MEFEPFQECRSAEGWQPVKVASSSEEGVVYTVLVNPWGFLEENICDCKGYLYRGHCKHQGIASDKVCCWNEKTGIKQSKNDRAAMACPVCGGPTRWSIEVKEQDGGQRT